MKINITSVLRFMDKYMKSKFDFSLPHSSDYDNVKQFKTISNDIHIHIDFSHQIASEVRDSYP